MRKTLKSLGFLFCLSLLAGSCSYWPLGGFNAPVKKFPVQPTTAGALLNQIESRHQPIDNMISTLEVLVSGVPGQSGKNKLQITNLYREPDKLLIKADHAVQGAVFAVIQNGENAAIRLYSEGEWYNGTLADLDAHPEALFGLRPVDIVGALLSNQEIVELLKLVPPETVMPEISPESEHWIISTEAAWNRKEFFYVRKSDGLVEKIAIYDENKQPRILVTYKQYAKFNDNDQIFPSRFELTFANTKMRLDVRKVKSVYLTPILEDKHFPTEPEPGLVVKRQSLSSWFSQRNDLARQ